MALKLNIMEREYIIIGNNKYPEGVEHYYKLGETVFYFADKFREYHKLKVINKDGKIQTVLKAHLKEVL